MDGVSDQRDHGERTVIPYCIIIITGIAEWILGIRTGKWMGFLTRETMENAQSFHTV